MVENGGKVQMSWEKNENKGVNRKKAKRKSSRVSWTTATIIQQFI